MSFLKIMDFHGENYSCPQRYARSRRARRCPLRRQKQTDTMFWRVKNQAFSNEIWDFPGPFHLNQSILLFRKDGWETFLKVQQISANQWPWIVIWLLTGILISDILGYKQKWLAEKFRKSSGIFQPSLISQRLIQVKKYADPRFFPWYSKKCFLNILFFCRVTLWLSNIAIENGPFIVDEPIKHGDFPSFFVC